MIRIAAALFAASLAACSVWPWGEEGQEGEVESTDDRTTQPETAPIANPPLTGAHPSRTLANGLTVVVVEDRTLPIVATALAYRVGSSDEPPGITGVSHFIEHMMFKGTPTYAKGAIDLFTFLSGGSNNAWTSEDLTLYHFAVARDRWREVLAIEAERMRLCLLDAAEFEAEKTVILQELNRALDGPWGRLLLETERRLYPEGHPYHHPVLGWRQDLEAMTRDGMAQYYSRMYAPDHAVLVVAGDVRSDEVFSYAEAVFGPLAAPPVDAAPAASAGGIDERSFEIDTPHNVSRVLMAYRGSRWGSNDQVALDVLAAALGTGRLSRLHQRLVERDRSTREGGFWVWNDARRHGGMFVIGVELNPGVAPDAVIAAVDEEVARVISDGVDAAELARAQTILIADHAFEAEEVGSMAQSVAVSWAMGTPDHWQTYPDRVRQITVDVLRSAAGAVLTTDRRVVGTARGDATGFIPSGRPARPARHGHDAGPGRAAVDDPPPPELGEVHTIRLPNGLTLIVHPRRDLPIVAVRAYVESGPAYEPMGRSGLSYLTGRMLDQGTSNSITGETRTYEQIAGTIERVGGRLEASTNGVSVQVLRDHEDLAYDLVRDLLMYPSFPEDRLERIRFDLLGEIEARDDDPAGYARRLMREVVFQGHPLGRPEEGLNAGEVRAIARGDVLEHYRRHFRPENTVIAVVGDVTPSRVEDSIRRRLGIEWLGGGEALALPPAPPRTGESRLMAVHRPTRQVHVVLGHVGIERAHPEYEAVRMAEYILCRGAGFTDRLSRVVRDDAGLAYEVWGTITGAADRWPGLITFYVGAEAADNDRATALMLETIGTFLRDGPTEEEVANSRSYLLRSFVFRWETCAATAEYLVSVHRFGLGTDYPRRFFAEMGGLTPEEIRRAAAAVLDPARLTRVVVGPVDSEGRVVEEPR